MDPVSKARVSDSKDDAQSRRLANLKKWKPGESGNPGGRKKKPITEIMEKLLADKSNRAEIEEVVMDVIRSRRMASVLMLKEVTERIEGKVTQELELSGNVSSLPDDELTAKLAALIEGEK
jgi:hypothetical protein